jgi:hypothetical protein
MAAWIYVFALSGGDRRSIAQSHRVRRLVERHPSLVRAPAALTRDRDWLVAQRALDLLEKVAHDYPELVAPHKRVFLRSRTATSGKSGCRSCERCLSFHGPRNQLHRVERILVESVSFPQTFVRAWALDSLSLLAERRPSLRAIVQRHVRVFERAESKALNARARHVRARIESWRGAPARHRRGAASGRGRG